ncbi:hypothetical protein [Alistipes putredinis]|uniref:hypothetical protein n=1 Tax=Alistipes putredinis TaxID=28117 RepID=UPI003FD891DC
MQFYDVFFHRDTDFIVIFTKVNNLSHKVTQSGRQKFYACKTHPQDQMLFRPGNPDDRIHHHALDRDRQPNLGRDKSQIGVFGTDYTTPKTGCPTAGVIDTIFFRKVVPTGGNRQNFRHDFQLLPQPFFG